VNEIPILVGGREFLRERNVLAEADDGAELVIYMAVDGTYAGRLLLSDTVREGAADAVRELADAGAEHIALLTSDSREIGARFAKAAGIGEYCSECRPDDKAAYIQKMKEQVRRGALVFIGDAAGDTPLPTGADVDVLISTEGGSALDLAADVVILNGDPAGVASAVYTSRSIRRVVWENIVFVLLIKAVILALSAAGISSQMWFAVFADMSAAMAAMLNSFRAFRMAKPGK
jgi:Cd2+/Zn2+-exporting ATPase